MPATTPQTAFRSFLYGGAATLLAFDLYFLGRALVQSNFVPILPIIAGILTAGGLLFIVYAEHRAREEDKRDHRQISRVAAQLEAPLRAFQDDLQQLLARADRLPAEERLKIKRMETKSKVVLENIRDVFLTLQAQEGPLAQEVRAYDLCALASEAVKRAGSLASSHNVELVEKMHCENAPVLVDRRLFLIALGHLIENAILYTLTPGLVNIAVVRGKKHARVIVQDRGIGIKDGDAPAIFRPFARGHAAEQYDPDGIGVGLTLARLIIQELKGSLRWQPREASTGSEFEIVLPLVRESVH